jgi:hypothetical protein
MDLNFFLSGWAVLVLVCLFFSVFLSNPLAPRPDDNGYFVIAEIRKTDWRKDPLARPASRFIVADEERYEVILKRGGREYKSSLQFSPHALRCLASHFKVSGKENLIGKKFIAKDSFLQLEQAVRKWE